MKKQSGFASIELVLLIVIVAAIGLVGYFVIKNKNNDAGQSTASFYSATATPNTSATTAPVPQVNNTSDLSTALNTLNQTDIGAFATDSGQLSTQSSGL